MSHPFRPVSSTQSLSKDKTGIQVSVSFDRDLTEDEDAKISQFMGQMMQLFRKNNLLADTKYMEGIEQSKKDLLACFPYTKVHVKEIPNEYEGEYAIMPWFLVTTPKGPIKIGHRKRVIEIDWKDSDIQSSAHYFFKGEDVTKGEHYIHAWGYDKVKEYLNKLLS